MKKLFYIASISLLTVVPLHLRADGTIADPTNVASTRPNEDEEPDGLTNQEEAEAVTYPFLAYSDTDDKMDGEDAWALDGILAPPRSPKVSYSVVLLPPTSEMDNPALGDGGHVVLQHGRNYYLWNAGTTAALPIPTANYPDIDNPESVSSINSNGDVVGTVTNIGLESFVMDAFVIPFGATAGTLLPRLHQRITQDGDETYANYTAPLIANDGRIYGFYMGNNQDGKLVQCGVVWTGGSAAQYGGKVTITGNPYSVSQEGPLILPKAVNINGVCAGEYALGLDQNLEFQERGCGIWNGSLFKADTDHNRSRLEDITKDNHALGYINYGTSFYAGVWVFDNATWTSRQIPNYTGRINDDMLGVTGSSLWRNDKYIQKESLVSSPGLLINYIYDINNSGVMLCNVTDNQINKNALLFPAQLIDTKDKVLDAPGASVLEANRDVAIVPKKTASEKSFRSIAWIEPHGSETTLDGPDMPQLVLRFPGTEAMGLKIKWKLQVIYNRPRGNQPEETRIKSEDEVFVPAKESGTQPWRESVLDGTVEIYGDQDWNAALTAKGFFGGEAQLTYQLLKSDGTALSSESTMLFSIGGKNPDDDKAKTFIDAKATEEDARLTRLSYAVARHESKDYNDTATITGTRYNQFWEKPGHRFSNDHRQGDPLWCKSPDEDSAGGFGIMQITGDATHGKYYNVDREVMWNWQEGVMAYLGIVKHEGEGKTLAQNPSKDGSQMRYWAFIQQVNGSTYQDPPETYTYASLSLDPWEMGVITLYNGAAGCPVTSVVIAGKKKQKQNPWKFTSSAPSGSRWTYFKNSDNYLYKVIQQR